MKSIRLLLVLCLVGAGCASQPATDAGSNAAGGGTDAVAAAVEASPVENPPAGRYFDERGLTRVALVKMPYSGARNVPELSGGPDYLEQGGLIELLHGMDVELRETTTVALDAEQADDYGEWHRMGMASGNYGEYVADNERNGWLTVGLLSNCTSLLGTLSGLQHSGDGDAPRKIAMVFIDAHGDFNTPESTLSGMLGGMPVAVSAGLCLRNLRLETGLDPALPTQRIVLGAARDLDPLERRLIEDSDIVQVSTDDFRTVSPHLLAQMDRLSEISDLIYIHIDMDVLDPAEVPGHPLTVPNGPTSLELAAALTEMFRYPKVAALGIASTPWGPRDPDGLSLRAAYNLIAGAVKGVQSREQ
jgi:arginase